ADGSLVDVPPAELRGAVGERLGAVDRVPAEREPLPAPDVDEDPARLFAIAGGAGVVRAADGQARRASRPRGPGDDLVAVDVDDAGLVGDLTRLQGGAHGVSSRRGVAAAVLLAAATPRDQVMCSWSLAQRHTSRVRPVPPVMPVMPAQW